LKKGTHETNERKRDRKKIREKELGTKHNVGVKGGEPGTGAMQQQGQSTKGVKGGAWARLNKCTTSAREITS